jgi:phosphatidylinositol alpha-1,6-mannosyltransferase
MKILYITPGCFDKGGISRYSRYQITALREFYGNQNIKVISFLGQDENSFESKFEVDWSGSGKGLFDRVLLVIYTAYYCIFWRPSIIHTAHINYSGLAKLLSKFINSRTILNVYGLELWTNLKKHAAYGLKNSDLVISDCFATKEYDWKKDVEKRLR